MCVPRCEFHLDPKKAIDSDGRVVDTDVGRRAVSVVLNLDDESLLGRTRIPTVWRPAMTMTDLSAARLIVLFQHNCMDRTVENADLTQEVPSFVVIDGHLAQFR